MLRRRHVAVAVAAWLSPASLLAAARGAPAPEPGWAIIGSFEGTGRAGFVRRLNDWLFENERDGDLYQDLGNLNVGVGYDLGGVRTKWDNDFERRVIRAHRELEPGSVVGADDLSRYREISQVRSRVRVTWDYLPDLIGDLDVGVQVDGGYVLALASSQKREEMRDQPERLERRPAAEEYRDFLAEHDIVGRKNPLYLAAGYGGGVIDMVAGALGGQLADTERAVIFFEDYAEPVVLFPDLGLPLALEHFTDGDNALAVGDSVTYTAFAGVSPLNAFVDRKGWKASFRRYVRFLRETTVEKRARNRVLVRVRRSFSNGNERIPLKYRPEISWFAVSAGYTFLEARANRFDERVTDVTYRIDLAQPEGRAFFEHLLAEGTRVDPLDDALEAPEVPGVERLIATRRNGPVRDARFRFHIFSWLRYDRQRIASTHLIETPEVRLNEVVRSRSRAMRQPFGRRRDYRSQVNVTAQTGVAWKQGGSWPARASESTALTVETTLSSRRVVGSELEELSAHLGTVLGLTELEPVLERIRAARDAEPTGLTLALLLSFGPAQVERLLAVDEERLWELLARLLLGPEHDDAWSTAEKRYAWMPVYASHGRPVPEEPIWRAYDRLRGRSDAASKRGKGLGLSLDHLDSRTLFVRAYRLAERFGELREPKNRDCMPCLADVFEGASDAVLLQALLVSLAGGVGEGGVGYQLTLFTEELGRPLTFGNDLFYTFRHQRREELVREVSTLRNAEPRLRAGELLLNRQPLATDNESGECLRLRLYSDLLFEDDLALRLAWREARPGADAALGVRRLALGEPRPIPPGPFVVGRYYYEVPLPWPSVRAGEAYTLLARIVTAGDLPVTEEQELRMELPAEWTDEAPSWCTPAPAVERRPN
jgi:hypothetical protein